MTRSVFSSVRSADGHAPSTTTTRVSDNSSSTRSDLVGQLQSPRPCSTRRPWQCPLKHAAEASHRPTASWVTPDTCQKPRIMARESWSGRSGFPIYFAETLTMRLSLSSGTSFGAGELVQDMQTDPPTPGTEAHRYQPPQGLSLLFKTPPSWPDPGPDGHPPSKQGLLTMALATPRILIKPQQTEQQSHRARLQLPTLRPPDPPSSSSPSARSCTTLAPRPGPSPQSLEQPLFHFSSTGFPARTS